MNSNSDQGRSPTARLGNKIRILLADDTKATRKLFVAAFDDQEYSVDTAVDGREAVDKFRRDEYDVVLTDIQMPVLDGIGAALEMRLIESQAEARRRTPIIAVTAAKAQETNHKCQAAGIDACLSKPVDFPELFHIIRKVVCGSDLSTGDENDASSSAGD